MAFASVSVRIAAGVLEANRPPGGAGPLSGPAEPERSVSRLCESEAKGGQGMPGRALTSPTLRHIARGFPQVLRTPSLLQAGLYQSICGQP